MIKLLCDIKDFNKEDVMRNTPVLDRLGNLISNMTFTYFPLSVQEAAPCDSL